MVKLGRTKFPSSLWDKIRKFTSFLKVKWSLASRKIRLSIVIGVVVLLALLSLGLYRLFIYEPAKPRIPTEAEAFKNALQKVSDNQPDSKASVEEKVVYLDTLSKLRGNTGDYQGAIAAFMERLSLKGDDLTYYDFFRLAQYYSEVGDKTNAISALDKAWQVAPKTSNDSTGYVPEELQETINRLKMEYGQ